MRLLFLLLIDFLAILFFIGSLSNYLTNWKEAIKGHPLLFRNKLFIVITGFAMILLIILFALGALMWQMPVSQYELIREPLYRLKQ